jgi:amino acid transporter
MRFADFVLQCAIDTNAVEDERLLRFLAVVILTFLCALHYRSARMARMLNVTLAVLKIVMLLVVIVAGAVEASKERVSWSETTPEEASSTVAAFLLILFSFGG